MSEPINQPPAPRDPGSIPTAKERIDAVLADRYPSVLSFADVEELMVRHHVAHSEMLEFRAHRAERERDEAREQQLTLRQRVEAILGDQGCDCSCWDDEGGDCQHGEPHRCPVEERCTACRVEAALGKEAQP